MVLGLEGPFRFGIRKGTLLAYSGRQSESQPGSKLTNIISSYDAGLPAAG